MEDPVGSPDSYVVATFDGACDWVLIRYGDRFLRYSGDVPVMGHRFLYAGNM